MRNAPGFGLFGAGGIAAIDEDSEQGSESMDHLPVLVEGALFNSTMTWTKGGDGNDAKMPKAITVVVGVPPLMSLGVPVYVGGRFGRRVHPVGYGQRGRPQCCQDVSWRGRD